MSEKYTIFYSRHCRRELNQFQNEMKQVTDHMQFDFGRANVVELYGNQFSDWRRQIEEQSKRKIKFAIFILAG